MKNFALIEKDNTEAFMIGVISNIDENDRWEDLFKTKFSRAIFSHFDCHDFNYDPIPDLFSGKTFYDIIIEIDGLNYEIRIMEVWIY